MHQNSVTEKEPDKQPIWRPCQRCYEEEICHQKIVRHNAYLPNYMKIVFLGETLPCIKLIDPTPDGFPSSIINVEETDE